MPRKPLTDEALGVLARDGKPEDLNLLTREEKVRMARLMSRQSAGPAQPGMPSLEERQQRVESIPEQKDPFATGMTPGLAGLAIKVSGGPIAAAGELGEQAKGVIEGTSAGAHRLMRWIGDKAAGPADPNVSTASWPTPFQQPSMKPILSPKEAFAERKRKIDAGFESMAESLSWAKTLLIPETQAEADLSKKIAGEFLRAIRDSYEQTVFNPGGQAQEDPLEFLMNVGDIAAPLLLSSKLGRLARAGKVIDDAADKTKDATRTVEKVAELARRVKEPEVAQAASSTLQRTGDKVAQTVADLRAAGADDVVIERAKMLGTRIDDLSSGVVKEQAKHAAKEVRRLPKTTELPPEAGMTRTDLLVRMASSAIGSAVGGTALERDEPGLSIPGAIIGGLGGFVFGSPKIFLSRYKVKMPNGEIIDTFRRGEVERLVEPQYHVKMPGGSDLWTKSKRAADVAVEKGGTLVGKKGGKTIEVDLPSFEKAMAEVIEPLLPDKVVSVANRKFNPRQTFRQVFLETRGLSPEVAAIRARIFDAQNGRIAEIMDTARVLNKADSQTGEIIDGYLKGELGIASVPEPYRDAAATTRYLFDELAVDLIEVGEVTGDAAETLIKNLGTYVPRLYLKHERGDPLLVVERFMRARGIPLSKLSDRDYLKHRKDIPDMVRKAWGEILDKPGYLLAKRGTVTAADIETRRYMNYIAASTDRVLPDELVGAALKSKKEGNLGLVDMFERGPRGETVEAFTRGGRNHIQKGDKIFRQMPENPKYGPLKGKYIEENIALDLEATHEGPEKLLRVLMNKGTAFFKASKVTWNPATLMRNIYGQIPLTDLGGVSPHRLDLIVPSLKEYFRKGELYKEARRGGLFGGEFYGAEIGNILKFTNKEKSLMGGLGRYVESAVDLTSRGGKVPFDRMRRFHEASEQANKMIMFGYARKNLGMGVDDAVRYAKRYVFDYREVPRWVQVVRKSPFGAPFISFSYKALPRVIESAISTDPGQLMRFWKYPMIFSAVNEAAARQIGALSDPESGVIPTLKRFVKGSLGMGMGRRPSDAPGNQEQLPDYVGAQQILLPWRDHFGREQYWDLTWTLPWGDLGEVGKGNMGETLARANIPFPRQLEPANPWVQMLVAGLSKGKDVFTGKDIVSPLAEPGEAAQEMFGYVARQFLPAWSPWGHSGKKLRRAGVPGPWGLSTERDMLQDVNTPTRPMAIASELGGIKTRPLDPRTSAGWALWRMKQRIKDGVNEAQKLARKGEFVDGKPVTKRAKARVEAINKLSAKYKKMAAEAEKLPETPKKLVDAMKAQR